MEAERYTQQQVKRLLGLSEEQGSRGRRNITILDYLSWARDPGGSHVSVKVLEEQGDNDAWMAKRGPLQPDSAAGVVLWDFLRAMRDLALRDQAVVALLVCNFSFSEIAELLYGSQKARKQVSRLILGPAKVDETGRVIRRWPGGPVVHDDRHSLVRTLVDGMNGVT